VVPIWEMTPRPRSALRIFFCAGVLAIRMFCSNAGASEGKSSEYIVDVWDIQDGLPHSTVTSIVQTPDGYLWCGTHDGAVRFDGVRFLRVGPEDRVNMEANHVFCLHVDRSGRLWLGTDGAGLLEYVNGRFVSANSDARSATNSVFSIAEDDRGDLWL